jgi:hypothetical protein
MIINVTQQHIDKGEPGFSSRCPIALAVKDATGAPWVIADGTEIAWSFDYLDPFHSFKPSDELVTFMENFDLNKPVTPFSFEAEVL